MYINRIVNCVTVCKLNLFADDALLWIDAENLEEAMENITVDFRNIVQFLCMMKLSLNWQKTKLMIIGDRISEIEFLDLDGNKIERVRSMKYLGVIIDEALHFKENLGHVAKKMSRKVGFLNRNREKMSMETRLTLYKCMIGPNLDYCSSILYLNSDTDLKTLQKIQNRALRVITRSDRYESINEMLNMTQLLNVKQRINYNILIFVYRAKKGLLPRYLTANIMTVGELQPYSLRNNGHLRPVSSILHSNQDSVWYKGIRMFNEMCKKFNCNTENINEFKKMAVQYVKNNYNL